MLDKERESRITHALNIFTLLIKMAIQFQSPQLANFHNSSFHKYSFHQLSWEASEDAFDEHLGLLREVFETLGCHHVKSPKLPVA